MSVFCASDNMLEEFELESVQTGVELASEPNKCFQILTTYCENVYIRHWSLF